MQLLKGILPDGMTVPTAYESVGHIAHLNLREEHLPFRHIIAQVHKINFFGSKWAFLIWKSECKTSCLHLVFHSDFKIPLKIDDSLDSGNV